MATIQANQQGLVVRVTFKEGGSAVDISDATTLQIWFVGPSTSAVTKTATAGSGTGQAEYTLTDDDTIFTEADPGKWRFQGYATDGSSYKRKTSVMEVEVVSNLVS